MTLLAWTAESDQDAAAFGWAVASAGDVNGDGYGDVAVGAVGHDGGASDGGAAFVYLGSAAGLATTPAWSAVSDEVSAQLGNDLAGGDVNGDGFSDLVVAAPLHDGGPPDQGAVYLYLGSRSGLGATAAWIAESGEPKCEFGTAVAIAGDVDGDGYPDVIVGAADSSGSAPDTGRAYLYLGSATGLASTPAWTAEADLAKAYFGHSVSSAGDVDGDGLADVVVGARHYGEEEEGRAFLYLGSPAGLEATASWTADGNEVAAELGFAVASAGDVDGDGYGDVAVGAARQDAAFADEGATFLFLGGSSGLEATAAWTESGRQEGAGFGSSLASAGDVDGDGHGDLLVGAPGYDEGSADGGMVALYLGSPSGLATGAAWTSESDQAGASLGGSVGSAGDVDGDGLGDIVVGAPGYDDGSKNEGAAFLYRGVAAEDSGTLPEDSGVTEPAPDGTDSGSGAAPADAGARCGTASARPRWSLALLGLCLGLGWGLRRTGSGR